MALRSFYISVRQSQKGPCTWLASLFSGTQDAPNIYRITVCSWNLSSLISSVCYLSDYTKKLGRFSVKLNIHGLNIPKRKSHFIDDHWYLHGHIIDTYNISLLLCKRSYKLRTMKDCLCSSFMDIKNNFRIAFMC